MTNSTLQSVSPALAGYLETVLGAKLWAAPGLSPRDRSIVTLAVTIARLHHTELEQQLPVALENGVTPTEVSEIVTHLAFYAGWGTASGAAPVLSKVFEAQGVQTSDLPPADVSLLPLDERTEATRAASVAANVGPVSPSLEGFTTSPLFLEVWRRPDLAPRDRSLVTVTSLVALGQTAQVGFHLNRAMDNGLSAAEAGDLLAHLAFYAGWPCAMSAVPVFKEVIAGRK